MEAIINNVAYSWSMIRISIPALDISEDSTIMQGVSEIKWNKVRKIENNYGIGGNAINRGFGNKTCTASITMDYNTVSQLRALAGSLMDLGEFDLIISFTNAYAGADWTAETVTLKGCIFNEDGMESKQDDTNIAKEYNLNPFDIITGEGTSSWL
jgi:hypothetical protein|nr:MAG TPA: putative XkdM-like protein [Caudoviricetes sp.]DAQ15258.1 MAG TPA: putative XkdM-like protein [Caudoviricetes sp.]